MKRVGLIGYGLAGRVFHAPLATAEPTLDVTIVVTSNEDRLAAAHADLPDAIICPPRTTCSPGPKTSTSSSSPRPTRCTSRWPSPPSSTALPVVVDKPLAPTAADAQRWSTPRPSAALG